MSANASAKAELRSEVRKALATSPSASLDSASVEISQSIPLKSGTTCAFFSGTAREPQLLCLLKNREIRWCLPKVIGPGLMTFHHITDPNSLVTGSFGILEPPAKSLEIPPDNLDLILCPGIAFSTSGQRLGQGGGYYDRYLPAAKNAKLIGVAFDLQIRQTIPGDPHDVAMDELITESRHLKIPAKEPRD